MVLRLKAWESRSPPGLPSAVHRHMFLRHSSLSTVPTLSKSHRPRCSRLTVLAWQGMISPAMVDTVRVRLARIDEHEAVERLQRRASFADPELRKALANAPFELSLPASQIEAGRVFVAELDGTLAGLASVALRNNETVELTGLFVEPILWRRGVGRRLVSRTAQFARETGAGALFVISSIGAEPFYVACGFATLGPYENWFAPALRMRLEFDRSSAG